MAGAAGAAAAYYLDPSMGSSRRAQTLDRLAGLLRRGESKVPSDARGMRERPSARGGRRPRPHRRDAGSTVRCSVPSIHRSRVVVNVEESVAVLRGVLADQEDIRRLEAEVRPSAASATSGTASTSRGPRRRTRWPPSRATEKATAQVPPTGIAIE